MSGPSFNDFVNRFKQTTKQAADQMGRAAKITKLKMDIMTLTGEKVRYLQTIGSKTYSLYCDTNALDGNVLFDRVRADLVHIARIDEKIGNLENEIKNQQALIQHVDLTDVTDPNEAGQGDAQGNEKK